MCLEFGSKPSYHKRIARSFKVGKIFLFSGIASVCRPYRGLLFWEFRIRTFSLFSSPQKLHIWKANSIQLVSLIPRKRATKFKIKFQSCRKRVTNSQNIRTVHKVKVRLYYHLLQWRVNLRLKLRVCGTKFSRLKYLRNLSDAEALTWNRQNTVPLIMWSFISILSIKGSHENWW